MNMYIPCRMQTLQIMLLTAPDWLHHFDCLQHFNTLIALSWMMWWGVPPLPLTETTADVSRLHIKEIPWAFLIAIHCSTMNASRELLLYFFCARQQQQHVVAWYARALELVGGPLPVVLRSEQVVHFLGALYLFQIRSMLRKQNVFTFVQHQMFELWILSN